jgi:hypothetical protein
MLYLQEREKCEETVSDEITRSSWAGRRRIVSGGSAYLVFLPLRELPSQKEALLSFHARL